MRDVYDAICVCRGPIASEAALIAGIYWVRSRPCVFEVYAITIRVRVLSPVLAPVAQRQRSRFVIGRLAGSNPPRGSRVDAASMARVCTWHMRDSALRMLGRFAGCVGFSILLRYDFRNGVMLFVVVVLRYESVQGLGSGQTQQTVNLPPCASEVRILLPAPVVAAERVASFGAWQMQLTGIALRLEPT